MQLFVSVSVCLSVCLSVSARQYEPVTRSETNVSVKTYFSGHVANVVCLCTCRRTGAIDSMTLYSQVVTVLTLCVCVCLCLCGVCVFVCGVCVCGVVCVCVLYGVCVWCVCYV